MIICIDVDGTLIDANDQPVPEMVALAESLCANPYNFVVVWSVGGVDYANLWADRLGLVNAWRRAKGKGVVFPDGVTHLPDIVIDDCEGWGKLQLIVKRGNGPTVLG